MTERIKHKQIESMLYSYEGNKYEIQDIDIEIERIKDDYNGVGPISYEERTQSSRSISSMSECEVIQKEEKIEKLQLRKARLHRDSLKVENALKLLTYYQRIIIENRYFKGLQWWQICSIIKYSERWAKQTRKEAIEKLAERIHL